MTIDEAIKHAREVASEQKIRGGICVQIDSECDKFSSCLKCAEQHEQLVEWLEELKSYRQYIDLTEIPEQYKLGFQDGIIARNNKAFERILDFMKLRLRSSEERYYKYLEDSCLPCTFDKSDIEETRIDTIKEILDIVQEASEE